MIALIGLATAAFKNKMERSEEIEMASFRLSGSAGRLVFFRGLTGDRFLSIFPARISDIRLGRETALTFTALVGLQRSEIGRLTSLGVDGGGGSNVLAFLAAFTLNAD